MVKNISSTYPITCTFISSCYLVPLRLFIFGNRELVLQEEKQLNYFLHEFILINNEVRKKVTFDIKVTKARKIEEIKPCTKNRKMLQQIGTL